MICPPKIPKILICENCDYSTCSKKDFVKHISTSKHKNTMKYNDNTMICPKKSQNEKNEKNYMCCCGKTYPYLSSLYNHKKTCKKIEENDKIILEKLNNNEEINYKDVITSMMIENKKLLQTISELIPKVGNNNNNNSHNTINNKQKFNINVFLNEQCKDALTMNEFIDRIKITLDDLMITKNKGLAEGVSNIFIENMNKLSIHERPMHCTDVKRETVYIKCDGNTIDGAIGDSYWEKDNDNIKLKAGLNKVTHIQRKNIDKWIDIHPNWENKSQEQDEYLLLVRSCTDDLKENRVIKKICNNIHIGESA